MSYRNPTQVVDTQTSQHMANLQNTISGTFQRVAKSYKADIDAETKKAQKLADERSVRLKKAQLEEDNVQGKGDTVVRGNKSINMDVLTPYIGQYSDYTTKIEDGGLSADEVSYYKTKKRDIKALPSVVQGAMTKFTMATVGLKEALKRPGLPDGVDLYAPGYNLENTQVWTDTLAGTRTLDIVENEKTGRPEVFVVIKPNGGESRRYSVAQLELMAEENGGIVQRVPNQSTQFEAMKGSFLYSEDKRPSDDAYGPMEINTDKTTGLITYSRPLYREKVGKAAAQIVAANIGSMNNNDLISMANNTLGFKGSINTENLDEKREDIKKEYTEYWLDNYVNPTEEKSKPINPKAMSVTERKYYEDIKAKQEESQLVTQEVETDVVDIYNNPSGFFKGLTIKGIGSGEIKSAKVTGDGKIELRTAKGPAVKDEDTGDLNQPTEIHTLDLGNNTGIRQFAEIKYPSDKQKPERRKFEKELMLYRDYQVAKMKSDPGNKLEDFITYEEFKSKQSNKGDQIFKKTKK